MCTCNPTRNHSTSHTLSLRRVLLVSIIFCGVRYPTINVFVFALLPCFFFPSPLQHLYRLWREVLILRNGRSTTFTTTGLTGGWTSGLAPTGSPRRLPWPKLKVRGQDCVPTALRLQFYSRRRCCCYRGCSLVCYRFSSSLLSKRFHIRTRVG